MAVPRQALPDDHAGEYVERGEQGGGAVALVVMGHGAGTSLLHGQARLGAVEGLDLGLLVDAQHDGLIRWVQVEADDVDQLLLEVRVVRELEGLDQMGFQAPSRPHPLHSGGAHALGLGHRAAAPVGLARGVVCGVAVTIADTFAAGIVGFRPRPYFTFPNFFNPSSSKRERHDVTLLAATPSSQAIAVFAAPSAASSSALARVTSRCGAVCDLASFSRMSRWPAVIVNAGLGGRMRHSTTIIGYL